jgi:hypothetical protein
MKKPKKPEFDEILTLNKARQYIHINFATLRILLENGEIPGRQVNGRWKVCRKDLDAWVSSGNKG